MDVSAIRVAGDGYSTYKGRKQVGHLYFAVFLLHTPHLFFIANVSRGVAVWRGTSFRESRLVHTLCTSTLWRSVVATKKVSDFWFAGF